MIDAASTALTGGVLPFGGSALCGVVMGFALKKLIKYALIILGVLAGVVFLSIQWLSNNGYIGKVQWDKLGNDIYTTGQHLATQLDLTNLQRVFHTLGIPLTSGLAVGMIICFMRAK
jgi:uncharacterized membrane protein (Fun14 family)